MRLKQLDMRDFRGYHGLQSIRFADGEQNVTTVYANNGIGKTNIARSVHYVLKGSPYFKNEKPQEVQIGNSVALKQSSNGQLESSVNLAFSHDNGVVYDVSRYFFSVEMNDGSVQEHHLSSKMHMSKPDGTTFTTEDEDAIAQELARVFPPSLLDYFFLDGEQIRRLMTPQEGQKAEVAKGIRGLLKIENLQRTLRALKKVKRQLESDLSRNATGESQVIRRQILDFKTEIDGLEAENESLTNSIVSLESDITKFQNQLQATSGFEVLFQRQKDLNVLIDKCEKRTEEIAIAMRNTIHQYPYSVGSSLFGELVDELSVQLETIETDFKLSKDALSKMLKNERCVVCQNDVKKGSSAHQTLSELLLNFQEETYDKEISQWRTILYAMNNEETASETQIDLVLRQSAENEDLLYQYRDELTRLEEELDTTISDEHIAELNKSLRNAKLAKDKALEKRGSNDNKIAFNKSQIVEKELKLEALRSTTGVEEVKSKMDALARESISALETIQKEFEQEMAEEVGAIATTFFHELIDITGRTNLGVIKILDDFSLQIYDHNNRSYLGNISEGQRQMLSVAFILSLIQIATRNSDGILEMPLLMDTPFGRLSGDNRDNLLSYLPSKTSQWIFLATDTELTKVETEVLRKTGKWGEAHELVLVNQNMTQINRFESPLVFTPKR